MPRLSVTVSSTTEARSLADARGAGGHGADDKGRERGPSTGAQRAEERPSR